MPFITEEIWQSVAPTIGKGGDTIMLSELPQPDHDQIDTDAIADIEWLKQVIVGVRNIRGEMNISPAKKLAVLLNNGDEQDKRRFEQNRQFLIALAKLDSITWLDEGSEIPMSATQLAGKMEVLVPMAGLIDK
ncbi:MAG: valine--tRNA ligase, partial [Phototrophicales bacterium]